MRWSMAALMLLSGCAATPEPVTVTYETDPYGAVYPVVNGDAYPLTDDERRVQVQKLVDLYCPAE